ncbi:chaplin family protein [Streptomyces sp. NBC_00083]|uniref:chaplin family protein n=1 Tax=Streptomyces sp. NBC_00083 TaxID=2975647 RepID=UPI003390431C
MAGGIGDFLSPAFGTSCANQNTGAHANGATTHGAGSASGNLAGIPLGSPLNQCGGADLPQVNEFLSLSTYEYALDATGL